MLGDPCAKIGFSLVKSSLLINTLPSQLRQVWLKKLKIIGRTNQTITYQPSVEL
jgi:hypothetical protein